MVENAKIALQGDDDYNCSMIHDYHDDNDGDSIITCSENPKADSLDPSATTFPHISPSFLQSPYIFFNHLTS